MTVSLKTLIKHRYILASKLLLNLAFFFPMLFIMYGHLILSAFTNEVTPPPIEDLLIIVAFSFLAYRVLSRQHHAWRYAHNRHHALTSSSVILLPTFYRVRKVP